jgi:ferritin
MEEAVNSQINKELYSSYLYLSMSAFLERQNLNGFANWMKIQSQEEYLHAMKFYAYLIQKGGKVTLLQIDKPKTEWRSILEAYEDTYVHELTVTESIDNLVNLALEVKDHATNSFLQWFVNEQVEEESNVTKILDELRMIGDNKTGLFMLDRELAQRVLTTPATPAA